MAVITMARWDVQPRPHSYGFCPSTRLYAKRLATQVCDNIRFTLIRTYYDATGSIRLAGTWQRWIGTGSWHDQGSAIVWRWPVAVHSRTFISFIIVAVILDKLAHTTWVMVRVVTYRFVEKISNHFGFMTIRKFIRLNCACYMWELLSLLWSVAVIPGWSQTRSSSVGNLSRPQWENRMQSDDSGSWCMW